MTWPEHDSELHITMIKIDAGSIFNFETLLIIESYWSCAVAVIPFGGVSYLIKFYDEL